MARAQVQELHEQVQRNPSLDRRVQRAADRCVAAAGKSKKH